MTRALIYFAVLLFACLPARVDADMFRIVSGPVRVVTFPLGEHYRVGRYVPVIVQVSGEKPAVASAAGAVPVQTPGGIATAVPLLAVGDMMNGWLDDGGAVSPSNQQLRPLRPDQRLVGIATDADDAGRLLRELFPAKAIVRTSLGRIDPLPGAAMAWAGLDAVLLDPSTAARVSVQQLATLRAAGVAVAIRVEARPAGDGLWQQRGAWWVLPPDESRAVDVIQPDRYMPAGDLAGASVHSRRIIVASLACFAIAVIAVSLWRSRRAWLASVALGAIAAGGVWLWGSTQPTSATRVVDERIGEWRDRYTQHVARADGEIRHVIEDNSAMAWPILFSPRHAGTVRLTLECSADGTPTAFVAKVKRGQSLVLLERSLAESSPTPSPAPATAPATRTR